MVMRVNYDAETDSLYVDLSDRTSVDSREIAPGVVADFDEHGELVGLDIDHASQLVDLSRFDVQGVPR